MAITMQSCSSSAWYYFLTFLKRYQVYGIVSLKNSLDDILADR